MTTKLKDYFNTISLIFSDDIQYIVENAQVKSWNKEKPLTFKLSFYGTLQSILKNSCH
jgi:hypothetical protein